MEGDILNFGLMHWIQSKSENYVIQFEKRCPFSHEYHFTQEIQKNLYLLLLGIDKRWSLTPFKLKDRLFLRPLAPGQGLTGEGGLTKIWGFFTGGFPGFPEGNRVPWSWESPRSGLINPPTENCRQFLGLAEVALLAVKFNSIQK